MTTAPRRRLRCRRVKRKSGRQKHCTVLRQSRMAANVAASGRKCASDDNTKWRFQPCWIGEFALHGAEVFFSVGFVVKHGWSPRR